MNSVQFLRRIHDLTADASTDELRIIVAIAERLNLGRERYGALCIANDERDWQREAREEAVDLSIYRAIAMLQERDSASQAPSETKTLEQLAIEDDTIRCEHCGWPLGEEGSANCWASNCSQRPMPPHSPYFARRNAAIRAARASRGSAETLPPPVDDRAVAVGRQTQVTVPELEVE